MTAQAGVVVVDLVLTNACWTMFPNRVSVRRSSISSARSLSDPFSIVSVSASSRSARRSSTSFVESIGTAISPVLSSRSIYDSTSVIKGSSWTSMNAGNSVVRC
jgi:hypothetical protein